MENIIKFNFSYDGMKKLVYFYYLNQGIKTDIDIVNDVYEDETKTYVVISRNENVDGSTIKSYKHIGIDSLSSIVSSVFESDNKELVGITDNANNMSFSLLLKENKVKTR